MKTFLIGTLIGLLLILLSGCATTQVPQPITVKVPVPVHCEIKTPDKPIMHFNPPYSDTFSAVRDLLGDRVQAQAYQNELEVALHACQ